MPRNKRYTVYIDVIILILFLFFVFSVGIVAYHEFKHQPLIGPAATEHGRPVNQVK